MRQHYDWSRKDCPMKIRATGRWEEIKRRVNSELQALKAGAKKPVKKKEAAKKAQGVSNKGWSWSGTFTANTTIVVRKGYKSSGAPRLHLNKPVNEASFIKKGDLTISGLQMDCGGFASSMQLKVHLRITSSCL